jgi:chromatin assembly factor 1 subunit A
LLIPLQEKEREERKAAREEKERKAQEAHNKSKALMANFFGKPKNAAASGSGVMPTPPPASALTSSKASTSAIATSTANPPLNKRDNKPRIRHQENEFCRTFRPFVVKKDAELAPVNHFLRSRRRKSNMPPGKGKAKEDADTGDNNEVIVISEDESWMDEDEDIVMQPTPSTLANLASLSTRGISASGQSRNPHDLICTHRSFTNSTQTTSFHEVHPPSSAQ